MTNIYEKSLELMDTHFESITDEEFMRDYLSVEESQGPLLRDFLSDFSSYSKGCEIKPEFDAFVTTTAETLHRFNIDCFVADDVVVESKSDSTELVLVRSRKVDSIIFDSSFIADNDAKYCELSLVA